MRALLLSLTLLVLLLTWRSSRMSPPTATWDPLPSLAWRHGGESRIVRAQADFHQHVRTLRRADTSFQKPVDPAAEIQVWQRQFHAEEVERRLFNSSITEADFVAHTTEHLADEAWLERHFSRTIPPVNEATARIWYAQHREMMRCPDAYRAAHLFLSRHGEKSDRRTEMQALHQRLQNGEAWENITTAYSEDARTRSRAGDLGWFSAQRMPADFIHAVQALRPGQSSPIIETALGWHIIRLHSHRPARIPTFEEVREEIIAKLASEARLQSLAALQSTAERHSP